MESVSLIKELKAGGYESCLITTFNIHFPFYEEVLLRKLNSSGVRHNVVLLDAGQCQAAIEQAVPQLAGRFYTLAPMTTKTVFHPKLILLLGKHKGLLAVGSHNLTYSGFAANLEITNIIRFKTGQQEDSAPLFWQAWLAIETWLKDYGTSLPDAIKKQAANCLTGIDWLKASPQKDTDAIKLYYSSSSTPSLWAQVKPFVPKKPKVCKMIGAFFDEQLAFINTVEEDVHPSSIIIGVQPSTVYAPDTLFKQKNWCVVDSAQSFSKELNKRSVGYIHAKAIYFEAKEKSVFISGSANLSAPAWTLTKNNTNAELVIFRNDKAIESVAGEMGFDRLDNAEKAKKDESNTRHNEPILKNNTVQLVISVIKNSRMEFTFLGQYKNVELCLHDNEGREIRRSKIENKTLPNVVVEIDRQSIERSTHATLWMEGKHIGNILLFFQEKIESQSLRGSQRKLMDAFVSLETNSPDFKDLFNLVIHAVFNSDSSGEAHKRGANEKALKEEGSTKEINNLVIDWNDVKKNQVTATKRMHTTDNLLLLLDYMVYSLNFNSMSASTLGGEDNLGRNEEEMVGADDEDYDNELVDDKDSPTVVDIKGIQNFYHKQLLKIADRLSKGLFALRDGKISRIEFLPKLLIVLQLYSLLKKQKDTFPWAVGKFDILPKDMMNNLFMDICNCWIGDKWDLIEKENQFNIELSAFDELIKCHSLLVWAAWYTDVNYVKRKPLAESDEEKDERHWNNALYVLLAQYVSGNEYLEEECIKVCSEAGAPCLAWLNGLIRMGKEFRVKLDVLSSLDCADKQGLLVRHKNNGFVGVRYCTELTGDMAIFPSIAEMGEFRQYKQQSIVPL